MIRQSKRWEAVKVALLLLLLGSGAAWAQDESVEAKLNLTQQQKSQLQQLREDFNEKAAPIKNRIKNLQNERKQLESNSAPQEQIKQVLQKIADEEISLTLLLRDFKKEYLAILTPEQIKILQSLKQ